MPGDARTVRRRPGGYSKRSAFVTTIANLYANDLQDHSRPILFTRLSRNPLKPPRCSSPYFESLQARLFCGVD